MATVAENLQTSLDRVAAELATGDIKPNYSINGQSVQWADYREHLLTELLRLQAAIDVFGDDGGIVEEATQYTT